MIWLDDETFSSEPLANGTHKYAEGAEILIRALALDDGAVVVRDLTPGGEDWELRGDDLVLADPFHLADLDDALADDQVEVWAQNSAFDRTLERHAGLDIPLHRWRDTMVQAMAHSLPGSLAAMCEVLRVGADKAKNNAGKALIQLFCKPIAFRFPKMEPFREQHEDEGKKVYAAAKRTHKAEYDAAKTAAEATWPGRATRESHPAEWRRFLVYAGQDIVAMRECHKRMPKWNYPNNQAELDLWHLDQRINDRGVQIDLHLAESAVAAVDIAQEELKARGVELTNGEVESFTQRDVLLEHVLAEYGVDLPDMQKATLERRIEDPDLPEGLRELLRVRLQVATTSTSKYKTLMRSTSSDGRLRNLLQFDGAARTGRWAGRLFQPQNLMRPDMVQDEIEAGIEALKEGCAHLLYDNVMRLTANAMRGAIVAAPGKKLVVADLSNIEGRDQAWLAGESWKLRAFAEFDTVQREDGVWLTGPEYFAECIAGRAPVLRLNDKGEPLRRGHDLYKMSYGKSFNLDPSEVTKDQRQVGKVQELALGYEGGVGAFVTFAANYGIDLDDLAGKAVRFIPGEVFGQAQIMLQWHRSKGRDPAGRLKMADRTWLVCESFKLGWRAGHKEIAAYWKQLDACVRAAIDSPGRTIPCGKVKIRRDGAWLRIVLPSGRALCYPSPQLQAEKRKRDETERAGPDGVCLACGGNGYELVGGWQGEIDPKPAHREVCSSCSGAGEFAAEQGSGRTKITYMGMNQYTRKWDRLDTYGGKLFENCIAANTEVLTEHGWMYIQSVQASDRVWDGVEWVKHSGCVYKGKQVVLTAYGVEMTPDHRVLTEKGWTHASSCKGLDRAEVGLPHGGSLRRVARRAPLDVGGEVRLRRDETHAGQRVPEAAEAGDRRILRLHASRFDRSTEHFARYERAPSVRGVARGAGPLRAADTPGLPELWCAGYRGLRSVARIVRKLLGGHGANIRNRPHPGAQEERSRVFARELPMALDAATGEQSAHLSSDRNAGRHDHSVASRAQVRGGAVDVELPTGGGVAGGARTRPVFDLIDCGPRHRFVVRGADGLPLIVHNCCQAVARDVMAHNMPAIEAAGYHIVLSVHDELICEAPDTDEYTAERLSALLAANPPWALDMPLAAAGFEAYRYKKE